MHISTRAVINLAGTVGATVAGAATMVVIALVLGPASLGTYALAIAVSLWVILPVGSIAGAVEKRTSETGDGGYLIAGALLGIGILGIILITVRASAPLFRDYTGTSTPLILLLIGSRGVASLSASSFIARGRADLKGILDGLQQFARFGAVAITLTIGWKIDGVIIAHATAELGIWLLAALLYGNQFQIAYPTWKHIRSLLKYARHFWLNIVRVQGLSWTDTLVLGLFVSPTFIGVYEIGWRMARLLSLVSKSIKQITLPEISIPTGENAIMIDYLRRVTSDSLAYPGLLAIPGLAGALVLRQSLFTIFGRDFLIPGVGFVLILLVSAQLLETYADLLILGLNAADRTREAFRVNGTVMALNVVLNIVLINMYGWMGAAVSTFLASGVSLVLGYWRLSSVIGGLKLPLADIKDQIVAAAFMGITLLAITAHSQPTTRISVLGLVGGSAILYFIVLYKLSDRVQNTIARIVHDFQSAF